MDGTAIFSALVDFAATASSPSSNQPTPTLAHLLVGVSTSSPTPTSVAQVLANDASKQIYTALLANAALPSPLLPTPSSTSLVDSVKFSFLATTSTSTLSTPSTSLGFLTSRLALLPSSVQILLGVFLLLLSLFTLSCGARGAYWGREWGRKRGTEGRGWLGGGVGGAAMGSVAVGAFSAFLVLAVVSHQSSPSLGGWATLAIVVIPSILGAVICGRWSWGANVAYSLVGSTSFTLLLTCTLLRTTTPLPRLIVLLLPVLLSLLTTFLPSPRRYSLPALAALSGAYLLVLAIDIFTGVQMGYVDALGLLLCTNGVGEGGGKAEKAVVEWGTSGGKGLMAAWWISAVVRGATMGWWGLGIDGDESWESYLSSLIYAHPSTPSGTHLPPLTPFERFQSFFSFLHRPRSRPHPRGGKFTDLPSSAASQRRSVPWDDEETVWNAEEEDEDDDGEGKISMRSLPRTCASKYPRYHPHHAKSSPAASSMRSGNSSAPARYGAVSLSDAEENEEGEEDDKTGLWSADIARMSESHSTTDPASPPRRPKLVSPSTAGASGSVRSGLSGSTAVSFAPEPWAKRGKSLDYDHAGHEDDSEEQEDEVASLPILSRSATSPPSSPNTVPATPSLLLALDRVRRAQSQARGVDSGRRAEETVEVKKALSRRGSLSVEEAEGGGRGGGGGRERERSKSMDEWWDDVVKKSEGR